MALSTKEKIIKEAIELFSRLGYKGTTVRKIAGAVGIKQSALYNHFRNKEEIFETIIEQIGATALNDLYEGENPYPEIVRTAPCEGETLFPEVASHTGPCVSPLIGENKRGLAARGVCDFPIG